MTAWEPAAGDWVAPLKPRACMGIQANRLCLVMDVYRGWVRLEGIECHWPVRQFRLATQGELAKHQLASLTTLEGL